MTLYSSGHRYYTNADHAKIGRHHLSVAGIQGTYSLQTLMVIDSPTRSCKNNTSRSTNSCSVDRGADADGSSIADAGSHSYGNGLKAGTGISSTQVFRMTKKS